MFKMFYFFWIIEGIFSFELFELFDIEFKLYGFKDFIKIGFR